MPFLLSGAFRSRTGAHRAVGAACLVLGVSMEVVAQPRGDGHAWFEQRYERFGPYGNVHRQEGGVFHVNGRFFPVNRGVWDYWLDASAVGQEFRLRGSEIPASIGRLDLQLGDHAPADPRRDPFWYEFQPQIWLRGATAELRRRQLSLGLRTGVLTEQRNLFGWGRSAVDTRTIGGSVLGRRGGSDLWMAALDAQTALPDGQPGRQVGWLFWGHAPAVGWSWMGQAALSREEVTGNWGGSLLARGGYRNSRRAVMALVRRVSPGFRNLGLHLSPHVNEWGARLEVNQRLDPSGAVGASLDMAQDLERRRSGHPIERRLVCRIHASTPIAGPLALHADIGFHDRSTPDPDSLLVDQTAVLGGMRFGFKTTKTQGEISGRRTIFRDPTSDPGDWHESRIGGMLRHSLDSRFRVETKLWLADRRRPSGLWLSRERSAELRLNWDPTSGLGGWVTMGRERQEADDIALARDQWQIGLGWEQSLPFDLLLEVDTFHYIAAGDLRADRSRWSFRLGRSFRFAGGPSEEQEGPLEFGRIEGRVYEDRNGNGLRDPGESGIPDIILQLGSRQRIVTDADGHYLFSQAATRRESMTLDVARLPTRYLAPDEPKLLANLAPGQEIVHDYPIRLSSGVTGQVVFFDGHRAVGVPDVLVVVKDTHQDIFTDKEGRFLIPGLAVGRITLEIVDWSLPEKTRPHDSLRRRVSIRAGETVYAGVFVLVPAEVKVLQFFQPEGQPGR